MKLHNPVQNQAVLSNVGEIGEFRIRNSAKAFNILSSGLYANKIRAIIRELSCNAVDSHVAAGKQNTPFDVHLPSTLEPWFSIRDYGTGLNHDQVTNIYTTYFESTKTDSNDFVGALGLGSKSPFSYTDNFTVTAIQNKRKGIYTAFINEQGVPSIALMSETETEDPNGVEVKFAVNDRYDFDKFLIEAKNVYKYFKLRPVVHGLSNFTFAEIRYKEKDIVPGIHTIDDYHSIAIMGNIAYPIDVPQADNNLGNLRRLLDCGLVIEFDIGELDFQASREGLSYIPSTIASIKNKLAKLNDQLTVYITKEANKIKNLWERLDYLQTKSRQGLWNESVIKYINDTKLPIADTNYYGILKPFMLDDSELAEKYNIAINGFLKSRGELKCYNLKTENTYDEVTKTYQHKWKINPCLNTYFVVAHQKRGPLEKTKNYFRSEEQEHQTIHVYLIQPADKTKPINTVKFFKDLYNPPKIFDADSFVESQDTINIRNYRKASILRYEKRERGRYNTTYVWANQGCLQDYNDPNKTYYYIEMDHWTPLNLPTGMDMDTFRRYISDSCLYDGQILGVRKRDIDLVKQQNNWVNLTQYIRDQLSQTNLNDVMSLVKEAIDFNSFFKYINKNINTDSPYYKMYVEFKDVKTTNSTVRFGLEKLLKSYNIKVNDQNPDTVIKSYKDKVNELSNRYPMLKHVSSYNTSINDVVDYINMVDQVKGI